VDPNQAVLLAGMIFIAAVLYSSVGHAGASGYLAAMALVGLAPEVMKPSALLLNVLVGILATVRYYRAGCFSWRLFWPFALCAIPLAFLGGAVTLPGMLYKQLVGLVLLFAAVRLFQYTLVRRSVAEEVRPPRLAVALPLGAGLGLLAGLTGTGGGIFLSPLLLLGRWAKTREASGVAAAFVLTNSVAGLAGQWQKLSLIPPAAGGWAAAAIAGGLIGTELGCRRLDTAWLRRLLAVVLVIAGIKLVAGV
jgi:uncharacterized protein